MDAPIGLASQEHRPARTLREEMRGLFVLAAPIAGAQAGLALMGLTDTAVVGRLGALPLSGVGLGNGIFFAFAVLGIGLMMGFDPLFAQALGAGRRDEARLAFHHALWLALFCSLALLVPIALLPLLLERAGVEADVAHGARLFIWARLPGLVPMLLFTGTRSYLQSMGRVRAVVVSTVVANIANLLLDLLFVFGWGPVPAMGVVGAGIATSLCSAIQFLLLLTDVRDPADRVQRTPGLPTLPTRAELRRVLAVGIPIGLQLGLEVGIFSLVGLLAARLGSVQVAAHQIALAVASFTFCFYVGVGTAGSVRVGWAVGAGDMRAMRRSGLCAFGGVLGLISVMGLSMLLFRRPVAALFSSSPEVVAAATPLLAVSAFFQLADGLQATGGGVLRGAGDTRISFLANLVGHWIIGLPVALLLAYRMQLGVAGLWWGLSAGLAVVAVALVLRFLRISRQGVRRL